MTRVRRLDLPPPFLVPPRDRRYCVAQIDAGKVALRDRHPRAKRHAALKLRTDQCGAQATHEVDGEAMCKRHAAERALEILMGEGADESGCGAGDADSGRLHGRGGERDAGGPRLRDHDSDGAGTPPGG